MNSARSGKKGHQELMAATKAELMEWLRFDCDGDMIAGLELIEEEEMD